MPDILACHLCQEDNIGTVIAMTLGTRSGTMQVHCSTYLGTLMVLFSHNEVWRELDESGILVAAQNGRILIINLYPLMLTKDYSFCVRGYEASPIAFQIGLICQAMSDLECLKPNPDTTQAIQHDLQISTGDMFQVLRTNDGRGQQRIAGVSDYSLH